MEITDKEKEVLLLTARKSIESFLNGTELPRADYNQYPSFSINSGAFVTLKIEGRLRGCIGYLAPKKILYETVCESARQAAFYDPRFMPLTAEELEITTIEISVLSSPYKIDNYEQILVGKHGIIMDEENIRAVLLPQVAVSNNYNREQFLSALCEKGGLAGDFWKYRKLNLMVFTATVFSEEELRKKEYDTG
jgi:AmmeMemoRadiSam system protein A